MIAMGKERRSGFRPIFRYPLFLVGLLIIVIGGFIGIDYRAGTDVDVAVAVVGFLFLFLSVALR
jgi:hypothetical protein